MIPNAPGRREETAPPSLRFEDISFRAGQIHQFVLCSISDSKFAHACIPRITSSFGKRCHAGQIIHQFEPSGQTDNLWHLDMQDFCMKDMAVFMLCVQHGAPPITISGVVTHSTTMQCQPGLQHFARAICARTVLSQQVNDEHRPYFESKVLVRKTTNLRDDAKVQTWPIKYLGSFIRDTVDMIYHSRSVIRHLIESAFLEFIPSARALTVQEISDVEDHTFMILTGYHPGQKHFASWHMRESGNEDAQVDIVSILHHRINQASHQAIFCQAPDPDHHYRCPDTLAAVHQLELTHSDHIIRYAIKHRTEMPFTFTHWRMRLRHVRDEEVLVRAIQDTRNERT